VKLKFVVLVLILATGFSFVYGAELRGVVYDEKGIPVSGLNIKVEDSVAKKTLNSFWAISDENGRFRVEDIVKGDVKVEISKNRRILFSKIYRFQDNLNEIEIFLSSYSESLNQSSTTGPLMGKVRDISTFSPISGAYVLLDNMTAITNSMGKFVLYGVKYGKHKIKIICKGYKPATFLVNHNEKGFLHGFEIEKISDRVVIYGFVKNGDTDEPVFNARVTFASETTFTDRAGRFRIEAGKLREEYVLTVSKKGYESRKILISVDRPKIRYDVEIYRQYKSKALMDSFSYASELRKSPLKDVEVIDEIEKDKFILKFNKPVPGLMASSGLISIINTNTVAPSTFNFGIHHLIGETYLSNNKVDSNFTALKANFGLIPHLELAIASLTRDYKGDFAPKDSAGQIYAVKYQFYKKGKTRFATGYLRVNNDGDINDSDMIYFTVDYEFRKQNYYGVFTAMLTGVFNDINNTGYLNLGATIGFYNKHIPVKLIFETEQDSTHEYNLFNFGIRLKTNPGCDFFLKRNTNTSTSLAGLGVFYGF